MGRVITLPAGSGGVDTGNNGGAPTPPAGDVGTAGGYSYNVSFLDSLYAAGKITSGQRQAFLAGSDPSSFGLAPYDLWVLTIGRLGSNSTGTTTGVGPILPFSTTTSYLRNQLVSYAPPSIGVAAAAGAPAQVPGIYQASADGIPAGSLPTNTTYFTLVVNPGPLVLLQQDIQNPALGGGNGSAAANAASTTLTQSTAGLVLPSFVVPTGRGYRISVGAPRPVNAGSNTPVDHMLQVVPSVTEAADSLGNRTVTLVPRWVQTANAVAPASGVSFLPVAAGQINSTIRVELV